MDAISMFKLSGCETEQEAAVGTQSMVDFVATGVNGGMKRGHNCTQQATVVPVSVFRPSFET